MADTRAATDKLSERLARLEREVQVLRDRQAIYDTLMRYCRGVDRCDRAMIASTYSDDVLEAGRVAYERDQGAGAGWESPDHVVDVIAATRASTHLVGNVAIVVDGDAAASESYFMAYLVIEQDGREYLRTKAARYLHRWRRAGDGWVTSERQVIDEWNRLDELGTHAPGSEHWRYGERSPADPVYRLRLDAPDRLT